MSVLSSLRKGFGFLLMAFGISNSSSKIRPVARAVPRPADKKID